MARGVNKVILLGNLGRDPEVRYTAAGAAVTSISIATSEAWRDRTSGEMQERTEWHNIVFFARLAEIAGEYLRKGSQIYVEGSLRTQRYTDRNGVERFRTEVIANELQMLGSAGGGNRGGGDGYGDFNQDRPQQNQGQQGGYQQQNPSQPPAQSSQGQGGQNQGGFKSPSPSQESNMPDFDTFDDDIPF